MKTKSKIILPAVLFVTFLSAGFSQVASAESLDKQLQQCKNAFSLSNQKDATQEVAVAAKLKHLTMMKNILHELNIKNADRNMSNKQMQDNIMVMSHLLEMMAIENLNEKEQTWNLNY